MCYNVEIKMEKCFLCVRIAERFVTDMKPRAILMKKHLNKNSIFR